VRGSATESTPSEFSAGTASSFQDVELVTQGEDFKLQGRARTDGRA
jgi:hypothetical protein